MIYSIIFAILAALSAWFWRAKYVPSQVTRNAADFKANGSADDLQKGYHSRETWRRAWPGLACCVVPSLSFSFSNLTSCLLSFGAMAALLLGIFIYDFTPALNLARIANGDAWLATKWYASPASKSWPDAAVWKKLRAIEPNAPNNVVQPHANTALKKLLTRTTCLCLLASLLLAVAAAYVASRAGA